MKKKKIKKIELQLARAEKRIQRLVAVHQWIVALLATGLSSEVLASMSQEDLLARADSSLDPTAAKLGAKLAAKFAATGSHPRPLHKLLGHKHLGLR